MGKKKRQKDDLLRMNITEMRDMFLYKEDYIITKILQKKW